MEISKTDDELAAEAEHQRARLEYWNTLTPEEQDEWLAREAANRPPAGRE